MACFEVWDVIKVPFPNTDRPVQQRRPALVVAQRDDAESGTLLWMLMITSTQHRRWGGDVEVSDRSAAGLPAVSRVRTSKIATIEARDAEPLGQPAAPGRAAVREELAALLAFGDGAADVW